MSDVQPSTFACAFCEFEDEPQLLKNHLIDKHAVEIAGQHWGTHIQRARGVKEGA
jgi:hypothetical protein